MPTSGAWVRRRLCPVLAVVLTCSLVPPAGATGGLTTVGNSKVASPVQQTGYFGFAMAAGDFDGDGRGDLAVGAYADATYGPLTGRIDVYLGSAQGLAFSGSILGSSPSATGYTLAAGDFDGNGTDEIATGALATFVAGQDSAGVVDVYAWDAVNHLGSLVATFDQSLPALGQTPSADDNFGFALAAGDFDHDGHDDLAIGVPFDATGSGDDEGLVHVLYGTGTGLTTAGAQLWSQGAGGLSGVADAGDDFGFALAAGDFDGDTYDDLAIGIPGDLPDAVTASGSVAVLYGSGSGLAAAGNQLWSEGSGGLPGTPQGGDGFGSALAAGDFDGDGHDDLAIGAPQDDPGGILDGGSVFELHGGASGLAGGGSRRWTALDLTGLASHASDMFGYTLATGRFDSDSFDDLAIGAPFAAVGGLGLAGALDVVQGGSGGLDATLTLHASAAGLAGGPPVAGDQFGFALASADFDGNGFDDLAIGIPNRASPTTHAIGVGLVQLLEGDDLLFADGFESGYTGAWSAVVP